MENTTTMEKFRCIKTVFAEPMNEFKAVELGYARPNEDNHEWRQGYHVVYEDGYHSWSPANVFHKGYLPYHTWLDRLKVELTELDAKRVLLESYLEDTKEAKSSYGRDLLVIQADIMRVYSSILSLRLSESVYSEDEVK